MADVDADADADGLIDGVFAECDFLYTVLEESLMLDGQTAETAATVVAESKVTAREELILALGSPAGLSPPLQLPRDSRAVPNRLARLHSGN